MLVEVDTRPFHFRAILRCLGDTHPVEKRRDSLDHSPDTAPAQHGVPSRTAATGARPTPASAPAPARPSHTRRARRRTPRMSLGDAQPAHPPRPSTSASSQDDPAVRPPSSRSPGAGSSSAVSLCHGSTASANYDYLAQAALPTPARVPSTAGSLLAPPPVLAPAGHSLGVVVRTQTVIPGSKFILSCQG